MVGAQICQDSVLLPLASGEGVFTGTSGVHRESLRDNNFHVQGCGNFLIICVKKELEFFKSEG